MTAAPQIQHKFESRYNHSPNSHPQDNKGSETEHINLKVLGQDNAVVQFKIKKHTPLRKLMNAYCDRAVSTKYKFP